jgi:hypothetical protein
MNSSLAKNFGKKDPMRRIVTAITAAAMALSLVSMAMPANAVAGYDSAYAGESAFLTLNAGQSGTFTVFFQNTGTTAWARGTASQVDLAACLEDKVTCNAQDASEAPFNSGWLSTTRYATHTQTTVAPGSIGTFTYNVAVPSGQAAGTYRFNGALVLSSTGADIHNEGYYQDVTVPTSVGSCTPTTITTTPTSANNQVGVTHTQSATVLCAAPTGSTTQPPSVGTQVTFVVDAPTTSNNADQTLTATTNASGVATVTWTRSNPGVDSVAVYPTSTPAVRATATKTWSAGAFVVQCEPTSAATQLNGTSRTYTVTVRDPATGALTSTTVTLRYAGRTTIPSGITAPTYGQTFTTSTSGTGSFSMTGSGGTGTPTASVTLGGQEYTATCGTTTFEALRAATITLTPDTTATNASNGNRKYTITAVDQFGAAYTGTGVRFSFTEFTDADTTTTTTAVYNGAATATSTVPTTCTGTTQNTAVTLSSTGVAYVLVCAGPGATPATAASATTTGTPIAWNDADGNQVPSTGEASDTGGAKTWTAAAATSASLSPSSATNAASSTSTGLNNTAGEETYSSALRDQSGNIIDLTADATITFTIANTGSSTVTIDDCRGGVASGATTGGATATPTSTSLTPGQSATCAATVSSTGTQDTTNAFATITIDSDAAGSANVNCTISTGGAIYSCTQATKTWVAASSSSGSVITNPNSSSVTATGTVVAFDTSRDYYTISTTVGNFTVFFGGQPGERFTVDGTTATQSSFESNLTLGDRVEFIGGGGTTTAQHKLTNQ